MKSISNFLLRFERTGNGVCYFIFFLICFAVYFKSLSNGYSLDDDYILSDPKVQGGLKSFKEIFSTRYITYYHTNFEYRPLTKLLFALEYQLFELKPGPAHFVNVLLYFFTGVLLFRLLNLLKFIPGRSFAFLTSLIFLVHPHHTEAVCSIKGADVLLSALFSLLSAVTAIRFQQEKKWHLIILSAVFLGCGFLSKLDSLPFIAIIPALLYLNDRSKLKPALFVFAALAAIFICFTLFKNWVLNDAEDKEYRELYFHENPLAVYNSFGNLLGAAFVSLGFYAEKLIFPLPLAAYYGYKTIQIHEPLTQRFFYQGIFISALLLFILIKYFRDPLVLFSLLMFFAPLSMFLNLPMPAPGIVADRFTFMSTIGFSAFVSILVFGLISNKKTGTVSPFFSSLAVIFFIGFSAISFIRNFDWKDRVTLIDTDVKKYPESAMLHFLKGSYLNADANDKSGPEAKSLLDSSVASFKRSLSIYEANPSAWNNLAGIYFFRFRDYNKAYPGFKRAFELEPHIDNKMLYAKSAFLSGRKDEFYVLAVKELNSGEKLEFMKFIGEFIRFMKTDSIAEVYMDLERAGLKNIEALVFMGNYLISVNRLQQGNYLMYRSFVYGNRNKTLAEDLAEYYYENGDPEKAAFLMDIYEGKIK